nr:MAG TPA: hypothetical protein [Bacteriophage sp.]
MFNSISYRTSSRFITINNSKFIFIYFYSISK